MQGFFTRGRRELIARTFATLVQIAVGGAIAGNIFMQLTTQVKWVVTAVVITLFGFAVLICPRRSDE